MAWSEPIQGTQKVEADMKESNGYRKVRAEPGELNAVEAGECPLAVCALRDKDSHLQDTCEPCESLWEGLAVCPIWNLPLPWVICAL